MAQAIQLSDSFGYRKLIRFTIPSIVMMVFTSVYGVVDGVFVSNFVGKTQFAAVNFIMPFLMLLGVLGFMLGTGGSALVAKTIGEGDRCKANRIFSLITLFGFCAGIVIALFGIVFLEDVAVLLGAKGDMVKHCVHYGRLILTALPCFILQNMFQPIIVASEKPKLGLQITVVAGVMNIVLDYLLIVVCDMGLSGAAIATAVSQAAGGLIPLVYFAFPNTSLLRFVKTSFDGKALLQTLYNGMSEFFANISGSIVAMCYNFQLMKYIGENGVAAFGVIMYVQFIFFAVFLGYAIGTAPIISYNYGAKNHNELRNVFHRSVKLVFALGIVLTVCLELLAYPLAQLFVGYDAQLFALTRKAFMIYGVSYIIVGFNFYASSFFTALNNGFVSAVISTVRALVFETSAVFVLPLLFGAESIWFSVWVAEILSLGLAITLLKKYQSRYNY
ncbi:MAG: MATE family efflux transporter [Bacteroidales bacterium]|nr:MATE family efflux transporter [Bacteroidales bacterium]